MSAAPIDSALDDASIGPTLVRITLLVAIVLVAALPEIAVAAAALGTWLARIGIGF